VCHSHCGGLAIFTLKKYLKAKRRRIMENSNISPCKNIIFKKKSSERNQNPARYYYNSII
jgi:hypothetical protein